MLVRLLCGLLLVLAMSSVGICKLKYEVVWRVDGKGGFSAPNCLVDVMTGRPIGIIVCEGEVGVTRFDLQGRKVWEYALEPPCRVAPAVGDVDGDGDEDIVAADSKGNVVLLSSDGKLKWSARAAGAVMPEACPAITDLDGDGAPEVLVGDMTGTVSCFDHCGNVRWRFTGDEGDMGPVLVADVYDMPGKEVIVTSIDRHIYALSGRGEWLWDIYRADEVFPNTNPVLADVDGDGRPELYVGGGLHHFFRIDLEQHKIVFEENVRLHVNTALASSDLDGDGKDEVVFGNKGGAVWCYGDAGFKWQRDLPNSSMWAAPVLADFDSDGELEILWPHLRDNLHVLDTDGTTLFSTHTDHSIGTSPLIGDFDGDGIMEIICTSPAPPHGNGVMVLAKLGVPFQDDPRNRFGFAGNRANTGCESHPKAYERVSAPAPASGSGNARMAVVGQTRLLSGSNTWRFDVYNPDDGRLVLLVEIGYPDGSVHRFARHVRSRNQRTAVSFALTHPGVHSITTQLIDGDTLGILASLKESRHFAGLESDDAYLNDVFADIEHAIQEWQPTNAECAGNVRGELIGLKGMLTQLKQEKASRERVALTGSLIESAERLRAMVVAGRALAPTGTFCAWESTPWAYFDAHDTVPAPENRTRRLAAALCIGEYESLALNVTNFSRQMLEVRVLCEELSGPGDPVSDEHIEFRRGVTVPTVHRERVADALPRLNEARLLTIPAMESSQLWITVNATGLEPGDYVAKVRLASLEPDPTDVEVPIEIRVHPLALPRPRPLRFCLWTAHAGAISTDNPQVLNDLVEHGTTVFLGPSPAANFDSEGNMTSAMDFTAHDETVKQVAGHGIVLFPGAQSGPRGVELFSQGWRKAFITYLRAWAGHMKELGIGYDRWALYPYDEPSTPFAETTQNLAKVAKVVREADPDILIYTDPTSGTTMETVKMLTGLIDIWCPSAELLERLGDQLVPEAKRVGKEVWFYDAAGSAKTLSSLGLYRWRFWYAWNQGFTGAGWWTYHYAATDPWLGLNSFGDFFDTVYSAPHGQVVSSKRWEAAREGVEDYEYLYMLREAIAAAEKRGASGPTLDSAKELLEQLPSQVEPTLHKVGRYLPLTADSVPMYEAASELLDYARRQIVEACLSLNAL